MPPWEDALEDMGVDWCVTETIDGEGDGDGDEAEDEAEEWELETGRCCCCCTKEEDEGEADEGGVFLSLREGRDRTAPSILSNSGSSM